MTTINNQPITLAQQTILIGEKDYASAIAQVFSQAQHHLSIFDQDLSRGEFSSLNVSQLIHQFLNQHAACQLTIILQDTTYFEQSCPRLYRLLQTYGHQMTVFETNQTVKHAKDCFVLADDKHYVKRIHIDHARFKYGLDDETISAELRVRFDELREATNHPLAVTHLGL